METKKRRVLLKISGEAFGAGGLGVNPDVVSEIAKKIAEASASVEIAIVVGGGNFFRGAELSNRGMDRGRADYMGMLGTVMNALALQDFIEQAGADVRVQTAISMAQVAEPYLPLRAIRHLEKGRIVIFGAGAGLPYFSTDTCAALRASEIGADMLMKATKVDGIYDKDPNQHDDAVKYDHLEYIDALRDRLNVMDSTAFSLCMENKMPILVFSMREPGSILRAVMGEHIGTRVD